MRLPILISLVALAALCGRATAADLTATELQSAKKLYVAKCAKCHKFYDPAGYDQDEWNLWMEKMRKKSKLKPDQYDLLCRYLATLRPAAKEAAPATAPGKPKR